MRADHVHLLIAVTHVDNTRVIELALGLQQGAEHCILTALLSAIVVELLKEVLVLVLGRGLVVLVFHLEHDRDDLVAARVALAEDKVALGTLGRIVIFLEVRVRKRVMRRRLNSVSQCCSSDSPTILVDRRTFMSLRRSISSSL